MPAITDQLDLNRLGLKPGGGTRFEAGVRVGDFVFGRQRYVVAGDPVPVLVDVSRTTSGYVVRVRLKPRLTGPCMRCFDDFNLSLKIDHSEVHEPSLDAELASEYVGTDNMLDLAALVRDAVGLAMPSSISGPLNVAGDCLACGRGGEQLAEMGIVSAQDAATESAELETEHGPDPRWDKLRELDL